MQDLLDSTLKKPRHGIDREAFAWLVLAVAVFFTLVIWLYSMQSYAQRDNDRFAYKIENEAAAFITRLQAYEQVLVGAQALFASSDEVTRAEWHNYVTQLKIDERLPGIQGTGYAQIITTADKDAHIRETRAEIRPDYELYPDGNRDFYTPVVFLEPLDVRNQRAIGYDMFSDPARRKAMERARDTANAALTAKLTLAQEIDKDIQPGFLMYLPVYRNEMPQRTVAERRAALLGFVYSPFRAHDLIRSIIGKANRDTYIEVYDGDVSAQNLLFESPAPKYSSRHAMSQAIEFGGRTWTLRFRSTREYDADTESVKPWVVLACGLALDVLLFTVTLLLARHGKRMEALALQLTQSRDSYLTLVENVPGTVFRSDPLPPWRFHHVSQHVGMLTGIPAESFLDGGISFSDLVHADDIARVSAVISDAISSGTPYELEYRIMHSNKGVRWVNERGRTMYDDEGHAKWIDGVILDITERRLAENAIRELAFYDPLTSLPNRRLLDDRLRHAILNSERSRQHGAILFVDLDNFKAINDNFGHEVGDLMLIEVARRLRESVREADTVARLGGDEFLIMLEDLGLTVADAEAKAKQVADKILTALAEPYLLGSNHHHSTPSIGISTFSGKDQNTVTLIRQADQAMYEAKESGRNTVRTFVPPQSQAAGSP